MSNRAEVETIASPIHCIGEDSQGDEEYQSHPEHSNTLRAELL